ncbi:MAG TPA: dehydrogenase E1 component subunit alpha/beta [Flavobacteriaceae bacterium]|nr:dehydrogenase E1 component subunit alpha/beta [Flavobacteriaceae bacterium]MCB9213168.1 dehydrogenase [Alteromonas sp.]HPF10160.1 dehydrogenase E1 component subunit alpha/beta [Flavobacteriaceae bacterium]HQU21644.1 dehydrogenase E1 component subunit alpha/beta [Flavobacteriaceae bacterium]HQU65797.1 dehydrogenase E1 component subunit alpha/beta [Flavobacteriaceae bacterium]
MEDSLLLTLYERMLKPRLIEEKMLILLRQGKISKWFSGIGQEAISVGVASVLEEDEYILPMHRNLGIFTCRNIPLYRLFSQWQGKANGFTKGRDRSFHFGTQAYHIVGMISHLGPQFGVADGIALGNLLKKNGKLCAVFTGEGGTSEGDIHEALNVASVWDLPVLFCIENNGYGLSTPTSEQYRCQDLADRAKGYGMESHILEGNNILEVYSKLKAITESMRENPRPVMVEFKTFRMRGHEEASGTKYVPQELMDAWAVKDPLETYAAYLRELGVLNEVMEVELKESILKEINENLDRAFEEPKIEANETVELDDVFQNTVVQQVEKNSITQELRLVDAISEGLKQSMERYPNLVLMGQDIAEYGGVFKITEGFVEQFGKDRVRNTPICESAIVSAAMGLSINGFKSVVEMQFADFVTSGFNPIVNYLAKSQYRWNQNADVVIRMPCGAGVGAGPFHSQTNEAWFTHTPGLKVVYPAFPEDAKGLLATAIADPNPVLFFEHKALYRSVRGEVPTEYYTLPLGKAHVLLEGKEVTVITYGAGVHWALEALQETNTSADLIDLRSLAPLDTETIYQSVKKTGKAIILQEDSLFGGIASDISALIVENCFEYLDAPVKRVASLETPVPFASALEAQYLAKTRFKEQLDQLLSY